MKRIFILLFCICFCVTALMADELKVGNYDNAVEYNSPTNYNAPISPDYHYSASQVIYPATELLAMKGKEITSITYKMSNQSFYYNLKMSVELFLYETEEKVFPKNERDEVTWFPQGTSVFSKRIEIDLGSNMYGDIELSFPLNQAYKYQGKNLVVMMKATIDDLDGASCLDSSNGYLAFYCYWHKGQLNAYNYHSDNKPFYSASKPWCCYDYPVAKFQFKSGESSVNEEKENDLPIIKAQDHTLIIENNSFLTIELFNDKGQLIRKKRGLNITFDALQSGLYIMRVVTENHKAWSKKISIK